MGELDPDFIQIDDPRIIGIDLGHDKELRAYSQRRATRELTFVAKTSDGKDVENGLLWEALNKPDINSEPAIADFGRVITNPGLAAVRLIVSNYQTTALEVAQDYAEIGNFGEVDGKPRKFEAVYARLRKDGELGIAELTLDKTLFIGNRPPFPTETTLYRYAATGDALLPALIAGTIYRSDPELIEIFGGFNARNKGRLLPVRMLTHLYDEQDWISTYDLRGLIANVNTEIGRNETGITQLRNLVEMGYIQVGKTETEMEVTRLIEKPRFGITLAIWEKMPKQIGGRFSRNELVEDLKSKGWDESQISGAIKHLKLDHRAIKHHFNPKRDVENYVTITEEGKAIIQKLRLYFEHPWQAILGIDPMSNISQDELEETKRNILMRVTHSSPFLKNISSMPSEYYESIKALIDASEKKFTLHQK